MACREHLNVHRLAELRDETVHDLLARCDGFRPPDGIRQLALVCEAEKRGRTGHEGDAYPQGPAFVRLPEAATSVPAPAVAPGGLEGPRLEERRGGDGCVCTCKFWGS